MTSALPVYAVDELPVSVTGDWSRDQTESVATLRNHSLTTMQTVDAPTGANSENPKITASDTLIAVLMDLKTMGPDGEHPQFAGLSATDISVLEWGKKPS
jgi:hypothetical protein